MILAVNVVKEVDLKSIIYDFTGELEAVTFMNVTKNKSRMYAKHVHPGGLSHILKKET